MMAKKHSSVVGITWIMIGAALLALLSYEPADIVVALDLDASLGEAIVVILGLITVAACGTVGVRAIWNGKGTSL
jgi:hypothetical protein